MLVSKKFYNIGTWNARLVVFRIMLKQKITIISFLIIQDILLPLL